MILFYILKKVLLVYSQTTVLILASEIKNNWPKLIHAEYFQNSHSRKLIHVKCNFFLTRENKFTRKFVRLRYIVEESLVGGSKKFDVEEMSQYIDQIVQLIGQAFNSVFNSRRIMYWQEWEQKRWRPRTLGKTRPLFSNRIPKTFLASHLGSTW